GHKYGRIVNIFHYHQTINKYGTENNNIIKFQVHRLDIEKMFFIIVI
ncbi:hypothetical protein LCGC14_1359590, partial [marine sediment metagenome]